MIRSITRFATLALVGGALFAGTAQAQSYPRVITDGENSTIEYGPGPARNIVGGALYRTSGSGESVTIETIEVQRAQPPRSGVAAVTVGSGESASVVWVPVARAAS